MFIAGVADQGSQTLALTLGNMRTITVPWSMFKPSGVGLQPDFGRLSLTDYGHTVCLGEYEAAADAILYEVDAEYRRKPGRNSLPQEDFWSVAAPFADSEGPVANRLRAAIAEDRGAIERSEVEKPHGETLRTIADRLGVAPEEIESY